MIEGQNPGYEMAVEEMRFVLEQQYDGIGIIKSTAQNLLSVSSVIVGLYSALQLLGNQIPARNSSLYIAALIASAVLYVFQTALCIYVLRPIGVHGPIRADWDVVMDNLAQLQDEKQVRIQLLSNYINAIDKNRPITSQLARTVNLAAALLVLNILTIMLSSWLSRL